MFLFTHLIVELSFQRPILATKSHIGTHQLLIVGDIRFIILDTLHTDVHAQQRNAKHLLRRIIVIPKGLHRFVGLKSTRIVVGPVIHVVSVLVVGSHQMNLMAFAIITQFQHIMGRCHHRPVVVADNTPVVIIQFLTTNLSEEALFGLQLGPTLI